MKHNSKNFWRMKERLQRDGQLFFCEGLFFRRMAAVACVGLVLLMSISRQAQGAEASSSMTQFRRGLATVVLVGLGGAVLGLSTLSFYNQPQERIGNVSTGFGLGLLAGSVYVLTRDSEPELGQNRDPLKYQPEAVERGPMLWTYRWNF